MAGKALVTVLIGDRVTQEWRSWFRPSWEKYAEKHGYDLVVIEDYLDKTPFGQSRTPNWQKLLICRDPRVARYDDVVWVDSDILMNFHHAPCIVASHAAASDKVGLVSNSRTYYDDPERRANLVNRLPLRDFPEIYASAGLSTVDDYSNTGVMVLKPSLHADVFEHVYKTYEENPGSAKEETPLSHYLFGNDLAGPIDPRFNRLWIYEITEKYPLLTNVGARRMELLMVSCATSVWLNSYFTHFTGDNIGGTTYRTRDDVRFVAQGLSDPMAFRLYDLSKL